MAPMPDILSLRCCRLSPAVSLALMLLPIAIAAGPATAASPGSPAVEWVLTSASWGAGPMLVSLVQSARAERPLAGAASQVSGRDAVALQPLPLPPAGLWRTRGTAPAADPLVAGPPRSVEIAAGEAVMPVLPGLGDTR